MFTQTVTRAPAPTDFPPSVTGLDQVYFPRLAGAAGHV